MLPMSNASTFDRRRPGQARRRPLVRSNSSLLGSIKNFVAAPFARLFTGNPNDFDDPNGFSGKRRIIVNQEVDNNDFVEDGPAPAKRMRVKSPSPPRSAGYLDPPGSAFHLNSNNNLSSNLPSRSVSIPLPFTTLPDYNARSTISPLRHHFSRNMSIDSIPSQQPRPLSRDITMKSFSSIPVTGSRESLPPMATRPFRLRESLTPQPHTSMAQQSNREVSEPPPVTALSSNPVFVRGPSQISEPQTLPIPTLGSLVDSQRITRSPSRQRTLLFGSSQPPVDPQAVAAERALHELEFYKTPLVPTRIRSRMPNTLAASASSSSITDMFARRHSLILMGDHDRPSKRDKKLKGKGRGKETNETKPYAGTTGIKKRLAKAKAVSDDEKTDAAPATVEEKTQEDAPIAKEAEVPVPPPEGRDTFNVAAFPSNSTPTMQSSLRVGRAPRSHLSRPNKKFSATYDDEDDKVGEETQRDLEMLAEAAKKVPVFEIPAGFSFAKDVNPVEPASATAKEPPILALPFSLSAHAVSAPAPPAQTTAPSFPSEVQPALFGPPSRSSLVSKTAQRNDSQMSTSGSAETTDTAKVPNFFASSKVLASQASAPVTPPLIPVSIPAPTTPTTTSPFSFTPKENTTAGDQKEGAPAQSNLFPSPSISGTNVFGRQTAPQTSITPPPERSQKEPVAPFSFGATAPQPSAAPQPSLFSFNKPTESDQSTVGSSSPFLLGPSATAAPSASTDSAPKASPISFGQGPTPTTGLFGSSNGSAKPAGSSFLGASESAKPPTTLFGSSNENANPASPLLFGAPNESAKPANPLFGSSNESAKPANPLFGSSNESAKPAGFSFNQSSVGNNVGSSTTTAKSLFGPQPNATEPLKPAFGDSNGSLSSPFSFAPPTSGTSEPPKPLFGAPADNNKPTGFTFGSSSAPSTSAGSTSSPFSFNSNNTSSPFSFGTSRPVTPPNQDQDQEVRMEESPVRDVQVNKPAEPRPSLSGFSFNSAPSTSSGLFGQSSSGPTPSSSFSFGSSSGASNPFDGGMATDDKPAENKPFGMGQSQAAATPFSFGRTPENDPPRPSTTGSFSFNNASSSTGPGPTFSFGAPSNNTAPPNPFGASQNGSTPNSPSTFGQPSPFATNPGSGTGNSFMFGSQPASPATPNAGLPPSGFGSSSNPFGAPAPSNNGFGAPPSSSGGNLFTIGAAPSDTGRQIKKMPTRKKR
ncbi:hypothetical protein BT96DRAFT_1014465 [Gymnopus androsaceus JB14]|uniref:Uncharacterized protein n=1 Tax=Gymnopus androsaceus JB14 TaxID=1447944 RepID=A0A6A4IB70_9AGAR|nr:hypothetical protein BT96DRAFT_1014465 [Gymnopus androsaceus JB14]